MSFKELAILLPDGQGDEAATRALDNERQRVKRARTERLSPPSSSPTSSVTGPSGSSSFADSGFLMTDADVNEATLEQAEATARAAAARYMRLPRPSRNDVLSMYHSFLSVNVLLQNLECNVNTLYEHHRARIATER